jgi:hypothetical protein
MSAARIIPFPFAVQTLALAEAPRAFDGFTSTPNEAAQTVTTVIVASAPGEGWVPPLSQRYPSVFESFAHWAAAERVGENLIIR